MQLSIRLISTGVVWCPSLIFNHVLACVSQFFCEEQNIWFVPRARKMREIVIFYRRKGNFSSNRLVLIHVQEGSREWMNLWLDCRIPGHFKAIPLKQWLRGYAVTWLLRIAGHFEGYVAAGLCGYASGWLRVIAGHFEANTPITVATFHKALLHFHHLFNIYSQQIYLHNASISLLI